MATEVELAAEVPEEVLAALLEEAPLDEEESDEPLLPGFAEPPLSPAPLVEPPLSPELLPEDPPSVPLLFALLLEP